MHTGRSEAVSSQYINSHVRDQQEAVQSHRDKVNVSVLTEPQALRITTEVLQ